MYKKLIVCLFFFGSVINAFATNSSKEEQAYHKISVFYKTKFPEHFIAFLDSPTLYKSLKKIPQTAYLSKKEKPEVKIIYHKDFGGRFVVTNVQGIYQNRFSSYNNLFSFFQPFMKSESYKDFSRQYDLKWKKKGSLFLKKHLVKDGSSYEVFFNQDGQIYQVKQMKKDQCISIFSFNMKTMNGYKVINHIKIQNLIKKLIQNFDLKRYNLQTKVIKNDFLG